MRQLPFYDPCEGRLPSSPKKYALPRPLPPGATVQTATHEEAQPGDGRRFHRSTHGSNSPPTPHASQVPSTTPPQSSDEERWRGVPLPAKHVERATAGHFGEPQPANHYTNNQQPGLPSTRPPSDRCFIPRTAEMEAEETRLRWALTAQVENAPAIITIEDVKAAVCEILGLQEQDFSVRAFAPENFMLRFTSQVARDHALAAGRVPVGTTLLVFRQWTRLAGATPNTMFYKLAIEIDGIRTHAWSLSSANQLLSSSCWIEKLHPVTADKTDMSVFRLTAWTDDPSRVPATKKLEVPEAEPRVIHNNLNMERIFANVEPYLMRKNLLEYMTIIHICSVTDFTPHSPSSDDQPSTDGDSGHDGNLDRDFDKGRHGGLRIHSFRCHWGGPD